ncbi:MAG TPA: SRPBCC family protein [Thermoleophilaceae bacterium]|jgi:uncharacterized protein YndB with AHSA1/START domain
MAWTTEHTEYTSASPQRIWELWSDVSTWPLWDEGLERVTLDGPFAAGTKGRLKPAGGPAVGLELTDVRPGAGFSDVTRLPLARMRFEHSAVRDGERTRVTHRVTITGPGTPLFSRLIGRGIANDLPQTIGTLARMAAERDAVPTPG